MDLGSDIASDVGDLEDEDLQDVVENYQFLCISGSLLYESLQKLRDSPSVPQYHKMSVLLEERARSANLKFDNMPPFKAVSQAPYFQQIGEELDVEYIKILRYMRHEHPVKRTSLREIVADFGMLRYNRQ